MCTCVRAYLGATVDAGAQQWRQRPLVQAGDALHRMCQKRGKSRRQAPCTHVARPEPPSFLSSFSLKRAAWTDGRRTTHLGLEHGGEGAYHAGALEEALLRLHLRLDRVERVAWYMCVGFWWSCGQSSQ